MFNPPMSAFELFRMMANSTEAWNRWYSMSDKPQDNSQRLMRLYMAYVNSGHRYLARWADIAVRRYPEFSEKFNDASQKPDSKEKLSALLDHTRQYIREMTDLPMEEAKELQHEIDRIMDEGKTGKSKKDNKGRRRNRAAHKPKRRARAKR